MVADDVQLNVRIVAYEVVQEGLEVLGRVRGAALAHHVAGGDVERRKQLDSAVAPILMGLASGPTAAQGEQRLGAAERLNLRFRVATEDDGVLRGCR